MYPPENIEAMKKVLRKLISNPEMLLEFRRHSRESAQRFGITRVVDEYVQIFEKVASG